MVDSTPTSVWYGVDDVLVSRAHAEHLLAAIPHAERREFSGGHVLEDLSDLLCEVGVIDLA
jgi:hypothetical protein